MPENAPMILVVDDNADLVALMKSILEQKNFNVVTAANGLEALQALKTVKPQLIVLDVSMPRMDGLEFYKEVCTKFGRARYPILVLTGEARLEGVFEEIEADGFLTKPFEVREFLAKAAAIIEKAARPDVYLMDFKGNPHSAAIAAELESERYKTVMIPSVNELKVELRTRKPRCVFMEYLRPEGNGDDFIREVKAALDAGASPDTPVFVYTYSGLDYRNRSLAAGAAQFIASPQQRGSLLKALRGTFSNGSKTPASNR